MVRCSLCYDSQHKKSPFYSFTVICLFSIPVVILYIPVDAHALVTPNFGNLDFCSWLYFHYDIRIYISTTFEHLI